MEPGTAEPTKPSLKPYRRSGTRSYKRFSFTVRLTCVNGRPGKTPGTSRTLLVEPDLVNTAIAHEPTPFAAIARRRRRRAIARFAFPHWRSIGLIVGLMLAVASINAIEPLILKMIFDNIGTSNGATALLTGIVGFSAIALTRELMDGSANWLTWRTRISLQYALLEATIGKLHSMPLRLQRSEGVGAIMTRLDRSIQGFTQAVSLLLFNVLPALIFLAVAVWIMLGLE